MSVANSASQVIDFLYAEAHISCVSLQVAVYDAWAAYNSKVSAVYSKESAKAIIVRVCLPAAFFTNCAPRPLALLYCENGCDISEV